MHLCAHLQHLTRAVFITTVKKHVMLGSKRRCQGAARVQQLARAQLAVMQISGSLDESIRYWDLRTGHEAKSIPAHSDPVTALDLSRCAPCASRMQRRIAAHIGSLQGSSSQSGSVHDALALLPAPLATVLLAIFS